MSFGDVKTDSGLKALNSHLATRSYITGFLASTSDSETFESFGGKEPGVSFAHVARWYNHIKSFSAGERSAWPKGSAVPAASSSTADDDDDDVDLFGSEDEEESEEKARVREERLQAYAAKKAKKPAVIAKTSVLLDVKPWSDETNMAELTSMVKSIEMDGLLWGADKLIPIGYGIKKLTVMCTVVDDKVSIDELQDKICEFEDHVQSCDIAAMNKI